MPLNPQLSCGTEELDPCGVTIIDEEVDVEGDVEDEDDSGEGSDPEGRDRPQPSSAGGGRGKLSPVDRVIFRAASDSYLSSSTSKRKHSGPRRGNKSGDKGKLDHSSLTGSDSEGRKWAGNGSAGHCDASKRPFQPVTNGSGQRLTLDTGSWRREAVTNGAVGSVSGTKTRGGGREDLGQCEVHYGSVAHSPATSTDSLLSFGTLRRALKSRTLFRVGLVACTALVAIAVPNVGTLIALSGATSGSTLSLIIPPLLDYYLVAKPAVKWPVWRHVLNMCSLVVGVLAAVIGTAMALADIFRY